MVISSKHAESETYSALGLLQTSGKQNSSTPRILSIVSSVLERSVQKNEHFSKNQVVTIFHASRPPNLTIRQYLERIFKYSSCSPSCFVVAYIYLDRFLQRTNACLTNLNVHRLLLTSILLATKFVDDECYNNAYYGKIGGISTAEINKLEMNFLFTLEFKLHVTVEAFRKYCLQLDVKGGAAQEYWINLEAFGTIAGRLNSN